MNESIRNHSSLNSEARIILPSGQTRWINALGTTLYDEQGEAQRMSGICFDITKRKQAEEALRENEKKLGMIFETMSEGIALNEIIYNESGEMIDYRILDVNKAFYSTADYSGQVVVGNVASVIYGMSPEIIKEFWETHRTCKDVQHTEMLSPINNKWFYISTSPFIDNKFITSFFDITERKRVEDNLRQSQELFSSAFHVSPAGITITRIADGKIIDANQAFLDIFGFSREETIGHTSLELKMLDPEERGKLIQQQLASGGLQNFEFLLHTKSGRLVNLLFSSKPLDLGGEACHITTMIDITDRKKAEIIFRDIIDKNPIAIQVVDREGYTLKVNAAHTQLFGSVPLSNYSIFNSDQKRSQDATELLELVKNGEIVHFPDIQTNPHSVVSEVPDVPVWIRTTGFSLGNEKGKPEQIVFMYQNITERKQAEQDLAKSHEQLRQINVRLVEVEEAERKALSKELHDRVGQSLTALNINLGLIRGQLEKETPQKLTARFETASELVTEITDHIRDVMAELHPPVLDDYGLAASLRWYAERLKQQTGLDVEVNGNVSEPRLPISISITLFRIAQEALTNIIKHANASLAIINVEIQPSMIEMTIIDNGIGFDLMRSTMKGEVHWGLLTMRERAEALNGKLEIESVPGEGTKLLFSIPR